MRLAHGDDDDDDDDEEEEVNGHDEGREEEMGFTSLSTAWVIYRHEKEPGTGKKLH